MTGVYVFYYSADEKLTDSFLLAVTAMVVLSSRCGISDARETFLATLCKFALPSLFVLSEKRALLCFLSTYIT